MAKSSIEELGQLKADREVIRKKIEDQLKMVNDLSSGNFTKEDNQRAIRLLASAVFALNKISIEIDDYVYGQIEMMLSLGSQLDQINKSPDMPVMPNAEGILISKDP